MDNKSARSEKFETEEVRELAEKLDRELEDYILNLEKRSSNEAWPEDRWQEVIILVLYFFCNCWNKYVGSYYEKYLTKNLSLFFLVIFVVNERVIFICKIN